MHQAAVVHRIRPGWPRPSTSHDNCSYRGCYNPGKLPQTPADAALVPAAGGSRGELAPLPSSARRLAQASVSPHTRRAYAGALQRLAGRELDDGRLAAYLAELFEACCASASAAMAVADARLRAKLAGDPDPAGPATGRVLAGFRRWSAGRRGRVGSGLLGRMGGLRRSEVGSLKVVVATQAGLALVLSGRPRPADRTTPPGVSRGELVDDDVL